MYFNKRSQSSFSIYDYSVDYLDEFEFFEEIPHNTTISGIKRLRLDLLFNFVVEYNLGVSYIEKIGKAINKKNIKYNNNFLFFDYNNSYLDSKLLDTFNIFDNKLITSPQVENISLNMHEEDFTNTYINDGLDSEFDENLDYENVLLHLDLFSILNIEKQDDYFDIFTQYFDLKKSKVIKNNNYNKILNNNIIVKKKLVSGFLVKYFSFLKNLTTFNIIVNKIFKLYNSYLSSKLNKNDISFNIKKIVNNINTGILCKTYKNNSISFK